MTGIPPRRGNRRQPARQQEEPPLCARTSSAHVHLPVGEAWGASAAGAPAGRSAPPAGALALGPAGLTGRHGRLREGMWVPSVTLVDQSPDYVDLRELSQAALVLYAFPGVDPERRGPGAYPRAVHQHAAYRRLRERFAAAMPTGGAIVAVSATSAFEQHREEGQLALERLGDMPIAHHLVSDEDLQVADALGLPTFEHEGRLLYEQVTLIAREGRVVKVFRRPTPGVDARQALTWLQLAGPACRP
jgi:peroxiredoxin